MKIKSVHARQILDSRGNPTVEADVHLEDGTLGRAAVPSGASTGTYEAHELRDGDPKNYNGKSVMKAVENVNTVISEALVGMEVTEQVHIDQTMRDLDGTPNKSKLGANAVLAVSLAVLHAAAKSKKIPLYQYIGTLSGNDTHGLPAHPFMNIINGGKHAAGSTDIQEFMIIPVGKKTFSEILRVGAEIFHALGSILKKNGYQTTVGDEGGYAPQVKKGNKEALDLISAAVTAAGYTLGRDVVFALDVAASELYENGMYHLKTENKTLSTDEMVAWLINLTKEYPIVSIEDGLSQDDWKGWIQLTRAIGSKVSIVGDDLLVTNVDFLKKGIEQKAANAILVKLNQIGTVTETLEAVKMAKEAGWKSIISHRSGETEDVSISHFVVGLNTGNIKTGSLSRTDRVAKYNELLRIEEELNNETMK